MIYTITDKEEGMRLDRWYKRHVQDVPQGAFEKVLRKGGIKVNDKKEKSLYRLQLGDIVVVSVKAGVSLDSRPKREPKREKAGTKVIIKSEDVALMQESIIHIDDEMIAINKPAGLAVQGGSKISKSVDSMLDYLRFDSRERPRLVHRLDKDTSGVLLLARDAQSATLLVDRFKGHHIEKEYLALIVGRLPSNRGKIDFPVMKSGQNYEKMIVSEKGQSALTYFDVLATSHKHNVQLVKLKPQTGRKHQLRLHMQAMGTPILGDGKYGGQAAFIENVAPMLHLHAYRITIKYEYGHPLSVEAPLSGHFEQTLKKLRISTRL